MSRILLLSLLVGALSSLGACASETPAKSKAFKTESHAPEPHLVIQWTKLLATHTYFSSHAAQYATPAHVSSSDELLVGTSAGDLVKFQAANGHVLWEKTLDAPISAQPASGQGFAFVGALDGKMSAFELSNGDPVWSFTATSSIETTPTHAEGRLVFSDVSDTIYALDSLTGEELWRYQRKSPDFFTVQGTCEPTIVDGEVFCGFADGRAVALQLETGDVLWEVDLTAGKKSFTDVDGKILVDGDTLFAAAYSSGLYAIDRNSGEIIWRYPLINIGSFVLYDGLIYANSSLGRTVAIDPESGRGLWSFKYKEAMPTGLISYGPYLVVTTNQGLYLLDRGTGYPFKRTRSTSGFSGAVAFGADRAYAMTDHGRLMTFQLGW